MSYSLADMPKTKRRFERFTKLLTEHAHWLSFQSLRVHTRDSKTGEGVYWNQVIFQKNKVWPTIAMEKLIHLQGMICPKRCISSVIVDINQKKSEFTYKYF